MTSEPLSSDLSRRLLAAVGSSVSRTAMACCAPVHVRALTETRTGGWR